MAKAVAGYSWDTTSLGPMETWPAALKIACGMMLNSRFPKAILWGSDMVLLYNTAFAPILGKKPNALGRSFRDVWAEAWDEIGPIAEKAMEGEATFIEDFPLVINRHGYDEQAYFTFCYSPIFDENGEIAGMMDTVVETTAKVEQQKRTDFLNRELHHRIKNMLASVAAIANQTLRGSISVADARIALQHRIGALASAHTKILDEGARRTSLEDIVRASISPHLGDTPQVVLGGPDLKLDARQAMAVALTVNELTTNAIKYGALSCDEGRVCVEWGIEEEAPENERFFLHWTETGGPKVCAPDNQGFGSVLISQIAPVDFHGKATLEYRDEGFAYRLCGDAASLPA